MQRPMNPRARRLELCAVVVLLLVGGAVRARTMDGWGFYPLCFVLTAGGVAVAYDLSHRAVAALRAQWS